MRQLRTLSGFRASFGAVENRIDAKINNLTTLKVNTQAAQSRIEDADFAAETTNMTKAQILSQAATSMLAQANASKAKLISSSSRISWRSKEESLLKLIGSKKDHHSLVKRWFFSFF